MQKSKLHKTVSGDYKRMLEETEPGAGCCGQVSMPAFISSLAGYQPDSRQQEAATQSFGCGNPVAFADVQAGQTVLDLGSGAGLDLMLAADQVGPGGRIIGVDMTEEMVEKARHNIARAGYSNIEVRTGLIEELPVEAGSVDWVISNCVINLSPDKPKVFSEIARVLKTGGQFSISDIVVEELPDFLRDNAALYSACVAGAIAEQEYLSGLRAAGLDADEVSERLVYSESQLAALVACEIPGLALTQDQIGEILPLVRGKVWSAKFTGRKPG